MGFLYLAGFIGSIPLANFLIDNVGFVCVPNGPCLIPVAPGIMAPSGVLMVGIALVLRDFVQRELGWAWALGAILVGTGLSAAIAPPSLVLASGVAFLLSELADFAVYTPLARRRLILAVVASGAVGVVVDSLLFLWLAFGSLEYLAGQIIGKAWAVALAVLVIHRLHRRPA